MWSTSISASAALLLATALQVAAQTPAGFQPSVSGNLGVAFGSTKVNPPGQLLPLNVVQSAPTTSVGTNSGLTGSFIFFIIDLDVPIRNGNYVTGRTTQLHALIGNYTVGQDGTLTTPSANSAPAPYRAPSPPPENPPRAHRYVELLYPQPKNFSIPASQTQIVIARAGFNIATFASAAGLPAPVRANYFQVQNTTTAGALIGSNSTSSGVASGTASGTVRPTASSTTSRPASFTGAASVSSAGFSLAGALAAMGAAYLF